MVGELSSVSSQNDRVPPIPADEVQRHKACSATISNVVRRRPNPQNQPPAYRPTRPSLAPTCAYAQAGARLSSLSPQHGVDGGPRSVVRVRPEVAVGVERLCGARVAEPGLDGLHRLAVPDEQARVEVPQRVEGDRLGEAGRLDRRPPDAARERRPPDWRTQFGGEDQRLGGIGVQVRAEGVDDDLGEREVRIDASVFGAAKYGGRPGRVISWRSTVSWRRRKSIRTTPRPKASPWRSPVPAASVTSAR